ncbi:putative WD repeat and SOCS box-containing protein 1-like isoform X1 [Apostichopus japonicus]|uniref:Putative WD repeat and SOCS box-containing protein 1-like isoform X1 n=1 Tax=Stichopus japonicus TaxID=307972 RepID=A0A2G8JSX5_STIJA|nr:putative WD repeat and SOCS box-containing protein 1-like isoform X1 [Apostichopus japonicus]
MQDEAHEICTLNPVSTRTGTVSGKETWSVAFTPDYSYFAWSSGRGIVRLIPWIRDDNTYVTQETDQHPLGYRHYQHLDDDNILMLAVGLHSGSIVLFNVFKREKFTLIDHKLVVRSLAFAPDGSLTLVSACRDNTLKVWDVKDDGNMVCTLKGHKGWVHDCAFSPDGTYMASVGARGAVFIWNMSNYKIVRKLVGHYHDAVNCQYSPDGGILVTSSWDARAIAWDPSTGQKLLEFHHIYPPMDPVFAGGANNSFTRGLSISPNGHHFATLCEDGYLRIWSLLDNSDPIAIALVEEPISCCFSPNGMVVAVGCRNGQVSFFVMPMSQNTSPKLQHLCRMAIRKTIPDSQLLLQRLNIGWLARYLSYKQMK